MKPRIIAVANQKGGVGKTTTTINLGAALAAYEHSTLVIDLDPQSNCTSGLGFTPEPDSLSSYRLLLGDAKLSEATYATAFPNLSIVPSTPDLAGAEVELVGMVGREVRLRQALEGTESHDFIFVDCPPSLGFLTINALVAAHALLIPIQCEYFALEGVSELMRTYNEVKSYLNPNLVIDGVLLTMYDERTNLSQQVAQEVQSVFTDQVFETIVPRNVRLAEAPSFGRPIHSYDLRSRGAKAYLHLGREFLSRQEVIRGS